METRGVMDSGVTVIGAEAPSAYEMAPRTGNAGHLVGSMDLVASPVSAGLTETTEKKKRGRPRKYGPDGTIATALSPTPISSSALPAGDYSSSGKRGRGRGSGYLSKQLKKMMENSGEWSIFSVGTNFTPHVITVNAGEDVMMKVISFSQQGPRAICILSANGVISNVTLRQPDSSGGTLTYEGRFEILSLSGSFMPTETQGSRSRSGGMSVSLASPDGRVVGGSVAGLLFAAGPVQVVVGSFLPGGSQHDQRPKKVRSDTIPATAAPNCTTAAAALPAPIKGDNGNCGTSQQNYSTSKTDFAASTLFGRENWTAMQEPRNFATDINISLPAG